MEILCAELNCNEPSTTARAVRDMHTSREYYIRLCDGHAGEFDSYHAERYHTSEEEGYCNCVGLSHREDCEFYVMPL